MKKNIFIKLFLLTFVFTLFNPIYLKAASVTNLKVGDAIVVDSTGTEETTTSGTGWSYENDRLTLSGYNGGGIVATGDLTVILSGSSYISATSLVSDSAAIKVDGILTIRGTSSNYSDKLSINNFDYGILVEKSLATEYTSFSINQASLDITNTKYGIYARNNDNDADNVKNNLNLSNSVVSITSSNVAVLARGAEGSTISYTKTDGTIELKSVTSEGKKYVTLYSGTDFAKTLNITPGYKITYSLNKLSLTQGSINEYLSSNSDFSCGFNVDDTNYALPTSVIVKVNNQELTSDKYTYNSTTGIINLSKNYINGDIEITANAEPCEPNPQTGTLDVVVKLALCVGLTGIIVLAKSLKIV